MTPISIFIKTCKRDLEWLDYCMRSIPFYTSEREIVLVADVDCFPYINKHRCMVDKLICLPNPADGYLWQQVLKLQAHKYCSHEVIIYLDSDCIFNKYCNIDDILVDNKLRVGYRTMDPKDPHYRFFKLYNALVEKELGVTTEYEFNLLVPPNIFKSTLEHLEQRYQQIVPVATKHAFEDNTSLVTPDTLYEWLHTEKAINEFNTMYTFAYLFEHDRYQWLDQPTCYEKPSITTFGWSWDDIETKREGLEQVLSCLSSQ